MKFFGFTNNKEFTMNIVSTYKEFTNQTSLLLDKKVTLVYKTEKGETNTVSGKLTKFEKKPSNGSVVFDIILDEIIYSSGMVGKQLEPVQAWEYKVEFGTTLYNTSISKGTVSGVKQGCNTLWVQYTNAFGMRHSSNSLLLTNIEFPND